MKKKKVVFIYLKQFNFKKILLITQLLIYPTYFILTFIIMLVFINIY